MLTEEGVETFKMRRKECASRGNIRSPHPPASAGTFSQREKGSAQHCENDNYTAVPCRS